MFAGQGSSKFPVIFPVGTEFAWSDLGERGVGKAVFADLDM
jgi:hypothetical protein